MRKLKKGVADRGRILSNVKFAMLGLGDSNYDVFNGGAKKVEQALKKAGAKPFVPTALADDGTGFFAPWNLSLVPQTYILALWF